MSLDRHKMRKKIAAAKSAKSGTEARPERNSVSEKKTTSGTTKPTRVAAKVPGAKVATKSQAKVTKPQAKPTKPQAKPTKTRVKPKQAEVKVEKPIVEKQPKTKKKIVFPKLGLKREKKPKARVFRSIKERSFLPLLGLILIIGGGVGFSYWYQKEQGNRLVASLNEFTIPENIQEFIPKNDATLIPAIRKLDICIPVMLAKYSQMNTNEKMATVAILQYETKNEEIMPILASALVDENQTIAYLASIAVGNMKELAIPKLKEALNSTPQDKQKYIIIALGNTQTLDNEKEKMAEGTLVELLKKAETSIENKVYVVHALSNFSTKAVAQGLISAALEDGVHQDAIAVLETHRQQGNLDALAEDLVSEVDTNFKRSQDTEERAKYLDIISIVALCQKTTGDNYISYFRDSVRRSFENGSGNELAAATLTLGIFRDSPYVDRIIEKLDDKMDKVVENSAMALIKLGDGEIPAKLLENNYMNSKREVVVSSIGKVMDYYHLHLLKNELTERAIDYLFVGLNNNVNQDKLSFINTLLKFTELNPSFMKEEYRQKIHAFIFEGLKTPENVSKYVQSLIRYSAIFPKQMSEADFDNTMAVIDESPQEKEVILGILERYAKNEPESTIIDAMIRYLQVSKNPQEIHDILEEYRKRIRGCHQKKQLQPNFASWSTWRKEYYDVEEKIGTAEKLITAAKELIRTKETKDLEEAAKNLTSAKEMYQNVVTLTTFRFTDKMQEIETLIYESNKARGIK